MEYAKLSVDKIKLDLENPRIRHWIEQFGDDVSSEQIALALSGGDTGGYRALHDSVLANRGIVTPIIVNHKDDSYVVVEGNTRVQIYRELLESTGDANWKEIIAIVHENLGEEEVHAVRLQSHLVGAREWMPFSKAKYLYYLSVEQGMPLSAIIGMCGGNTNSSKIRSSIEAYKDFITHYYPACSEAGQDPDPQEFSKFVESQKQSVVDALLQAGYTKKDFTNWVIHGNVDSALNVRLIPRVLANKNAREAFLKTNLSEASAYLVTKKSSDTATLANFSLYELADEVRRRLKILPYEEFKSLKYDVEWGDRRTSLELLNEELSSKIADLDEE